MDLTIAICTRNSARRIAAVLEALARQEQTESIRWEIVLIDNGSTDGTAEVVDQVAGSCGLKVRVVREDRAGLSYARQKAVQEAAGQLLGFVDDDNIVAVDWVRQCVEFMRRHPRAGLVGGRIQAVFEVPESKPKDFEERFAQTLGCWDLGEEAKPYGVPVYYPPCGAGLLTRTKLLRGVFEKCGCYLTGRSGGKLISGEDYEFGLLILKLGWEAWYTPGLRLAHVMPPGRLTEEYLRRIKVGNVQSEHWLNYLRGTESQRSRVSYLREYLGWTRQSLGLRMRGLGKNQNAETKIQYRQRIEEFELRADGAWLLFAKYPFAKVESGLEWLRKTPGMTPPEVVS